MEKARAGEAFVIPRGYDCQWHQTGYLRKVFIIFNPPGKNIPDEPTFEGIIIPSTDTIPEPGTPIERQHICYENHDCSFQVGVRELDPFETETGLFPHIEFDYILADSPTMTDEHGQEHHFRQGEALLLPEGVVCRARVTEKLVVIFAVVQSKILGKCNAASS